MLISKIISGVMREDEGIHYTGCLTEELKFQLQFESQMIDHGTKFSNRGN